MSLIERAINSRNEGDLPGLPGQQATGGPRPPAPGGVAPIHEATSLAPPVHVPLADAPVAPPSAPQGTRQVRIEVDRLVARGYIPPGAKSSRLGQELRVVKRPLISNAFGQGPSTIRNGKRVMVTSALAGEGKSFCAINLALSMAAEPDISVMLIDADVAKPSLARELQISDGPGLMDWLTHPRDSISDLVMSTSIPSLSVMTAGARNQYATELLASAAMTRLLDLLTAQYPDRILIFDSAPLLVTTESRVLATHMGQILMVVAAEDTPRQALVDALATIRSCEVIGLMLNKTRSHGSASGSAYGQYGYGYGYGNGA